ncbi:MAG: M20/M25/M40 family metallo-hydrolase [Acidobacteriota bacterium]
MQSIGRLAFSGLFVILLVTSGGALSQTTPVEAARRFRQTHEREIVNELRELLAIPNVASDMVNIRLNAAQIRSLLERRGVTTRLLEASNAPPVVFGDLKTPGAQRTMTFYAHYDGQPVEPAKWVGGSPFKPVLRTGEPDGTGREIAWPGAGVAFDPEWRIFSRSASDDKAPIIAILAALDSLKAAGINPGWNIKFFFEGEEEAGSPHLEEIVNRHGDLLASDLWLICDGPVEQNRRQQVFFGVRGVTSLELTVYGPRRELHSGHYGNWAPNPAMMLARLLASMKDDDGGVLIDGYYDGIEPLGETEKRALDEASDIDAQLKEEIGIARTEGNGRKLIEMLTLPSLNIRGMESASVGETARNVIPSTARAAIDIRLVKGIDYRVEFQRLISHIRKQGYHVVDQEPDMATRLQHARVVKVVWNKGYNAARTSMDLEISRQVIGAVESARGRVTRMPTLGGSVPLYVFTDILKTPTIGIPIANHDNNQHSSNENLRLQNLWDAIEVMAALITMR